MNHRQPHEILKQGTRHDQVSDLQRLLSQRVGPVAITGQFDYDTEIAVKTFQSMMFLTPDGIVGERTWKALTTNSPVDMPTLSQGDRGDRVIAIQSLLSIDLYYTGLEDGYFGPKTLAAVKRFQADYQLPANGTVTPQTWQALSSI